MTATITLSTKSWESRLAGFPYCNTTSADAVPLRNAQPGPVPACPHPLSNREAEVLSLVAEGYSNKIIAAVLGISERTVKSHLTSIMTKLMASDRTHAVVKAIRSGWLSI